jgi:hypothetical protein
MLANRIRILLSPFHPKLYVDPFSCVVPFHVSTAPGAIIVVMLLPRPFINPFATN